ncbi:hypothetical protein B0H14DRAFT_3526210 [Mycena olivaceomarginata]|nr:hypothetical protein B0H14DRAFT_3526210 [Mycena olivaceomarginata]
MTLEHLLTGLLEFATNEQESKSVGKALKEGGKETLDRVAQRMCAPVKGRPLLLAGIRPVQFLSCCYDDAAPRISYDTAEALKAHIGTARRAVMETYRDAHARVHDVVSPCIGVEIGSRVCCVLSSLPPLLFTLPLFSLPSPSHVLTRTPPPPRLKSLLPPDEPLLPGALYAAIAFLATSILTRHRSLPLRAAFPPLAGAAAFAHFLPHLSANMRAYAGVLEDAHLLGRRTCTRRGRRMARRRGHAWRSRGRRRGRRRGLGGKGREGAAVGDGAARWGGSGGVKGGGGRAGGEGRHLPPPPLYGHRVPPHIPATTDVLRAHFGSPHNRSGVQIRTKSCITGRAFELSRAPSCTT